MNIEYIQEILESVALFAAFFAIGWVLRKFFPGMFRRIDSLLAIISRASLAILAFLFGCLAGVCFWFELPTLAVFFCLVSVYGGFVFFTFTEESFATPTQSGLKEEQCEE